MQNWALLAILVASALVYKLWGFGSREKHLPPGPPTKAIVGNAHIFPPGFPQLQFQAWAKEYGDVFSLKLLNNTMVILSSPAAVRELYDKRGASTGGRPRSLHANAADGLHMALENMDTGVWKRGRKALHTFLTPEAITEYLPLQQVEFVQFLHDNLVKPNDLYTHIKRLTGSSMLYLVYGKRCPVYEGSAVEEFFYGIKLFNESCDVSSYPSIEMFPIIEYIPKWLAPWTAFITKMKTVRDNFHYSMFNEMEEKIKNGNSAGSYLEKVLANKEELGMSRDEIVFLGNVLMDAGGETTASSLQNMSLAIMTYTEQVKKVQAEIDSVVGPDRLPSIEDLDSLPYLKAFIAEANRFRPLLPIGLPHLVTEDIPYKGYVIPKGAMSFMNIYAILNDPDFFDSPETFRPERYLDNPFGTKAGADLSEFRENFLFGGGRRICPGETMGSRTIALNVMNLLWGFNVVQPDKKLANMDLDRYAKPGIELAPEPFKAVVTPRDANRVKLIEEAYKTLPAFS